MKKRLLYAVGILISASTFAQTPTSGLVAYYPFNGNASDESVNSNDGVVNGPTLVDDRFGNQNSAYSFNGISDWIDVQNVLIQQADSAYTINVWVKREDTTNVGVIMCDRSGGATYGAKYLFRTGGTDGFAWISTSLETENEGARDTLKSLSNWTMLTGTYDVREGVISFYENGKLLSSAQTKLWYPNLNPTSIGVKKGPTTEQWFTGSMDDIRVYNKALSDCEIISLYNEDDSKIKVTVQDTLNIYLSQIVTTVYEASNAATTIKVYPNPTENEVTVSIDNYTNLSGVTLKVINSQSAEVHSEAVTGPTQTIDVNEWSAGIYFLQVLNGTDIMGIRKVVVNN
jgi:hypothetical protein